MTSPRVSQADRAYFRRLGQANERLRECDPAGSLEVALQRLEAMEQQLGALTRPGVERDDALADAEAAAVASRWRRGRGVAA